MEVHATIPSLQRTIIMYTNQNIIIMMMTMMNKKMVEWSWGGVKATVGLGHRYGAGGIMTGSRGFRDGRSRKGEGN